MALSGFETASAGYVFNLTTLLLELIVYFRYSITMFSILLMGSAAPHRS